MSKIEIMFLDSQGLPAWKTVGEDKTIRFWVDGRAIECFVKDGELEVRVPDGTLAIYPKYNNKVVVKPE